MARQITRELAVKIAEKLDARRIPSQSKNHDFMVVEHEGQEVGSFGIRRGSEKDKGHDHIPRAIHVGPHFAKELARCPKSREDWIDHLIAQGRIQPPES